MSLGPSAVSNAAISVVIIWSRCFCSCFSCGRLGGADRHDSLLN